MPPPMAVGRRAGELVTGRSRTTTSALLLRALLASCVLPTRRAAARRAPSVRPATTWLRGWSGATTISPPRAVEVVGA
eukprot:7193712-Alexandrium_andersonii.AAC.1